MEYIKNALLPIRSRSFSADCCPLVRSGCLGQSRVSNILFLGGTFSTLLDEAGRTLRAAVGLYSDPRVRNVSMDRVYAASAETQWPRSVAQTTSIQGSTVSAVVGGIGFPIFFSFQL